MDDKIITLRNIWKVGIIALAFSAIAAFTLIFYTKGVLASCDSHDYSYQESEEDNGHEDWDCEEEDEPSPTPQPQGGQDQGQSQEQKQKTEVNVNVEQKQENNQTVTVTAPEVKSFAVTSVPLKQPETGVGVLGVASMAGAGPLGLLLARYGKGRIIGKKEEESLSEIGFNLTEKRRGKDLS
ncbi:hypothetical protein A3D07_00475 [Candidatus Curtissbacteria bacterium RIFCSPHIGHO2_02_FULL_42_15]|uniref:Uncharacterized protein n=1 Tax=Candidatus Curtissbacteria bacterium RIFCSPHIGHO2_02_FULL_42_15 TaxID=1797716 RepID=A0A1F5GF43_9BACT|nr:MAG: hypothetical protein A3D07_00475 [Candidatus Curtissbacteria bacterium RIFCSPHIGHO2_02_FULL_42_15]